jgi:hypothetical protein
MLRWALSLLMLRGHALVPRRFAPVRVSRIRTILHHRKSSPNIAFQRSAPHTVRSWIHTPAIIMRGAKLKHLILVLLIVLSQQAIAGDKPASDESIRELIEITDSRKLYNNMFSQLDSVMEQSMKQAMGTATFTPQRQEIFARMRQKILTIVRDEMTWESIEPAVITIYKEAFTEEEVKELLKFYRSKAGQALIGKMPIVMQKSMKMNQDLMQKILPRILEIQTEVMKELDDHEIQTELMKELGESRAKGD